MPQLDQFTYFSQFVWLTVSFCVYYVVVVYSSLPKLSRILKSRARFLQNSIRRSHSTANVGWKDEDFCTNLGPSSSNDTLVTDCIHSSANYLNASLTSAQAWCSQCISQFNINQLVKANRSYLKRLAEVTMLLARNTSPKKLSFERVVFICFQRYLSFTVERASNKVSAKHESKSVNKGRSQKVTRGPSLFVETQDAALFAETQDASSRICPDKPNKAASPRGTESQQQAKSKKVGVSTNLEGNTLVASKKKKANK